MDYRTAIQNKKMKKDEKWEYLYTSTYRDMYYTVWNLIDDKSEIEDILQNAYMHAYKKIDSLNDPDKFPAWMKRIVINMAFKYQKKKKPSLFPESVGESDQPEPEIADERPDTDPVYFLEDAEARDLLSALIDNLPIEQKQPLLLYHYEGISLAEIAKLLNCSINTVKSRLRYARKKLRENLEELREKGYSFNGVSPVSLVVGLLEKGRNSKEIAAAAERSSAVVFKTSAKWAAAETAASGSVTAIKVAGTTAGGIAMRIASGALATAFIGGAMYGVYKFERDNSKKVDLEETYAVTSSYSEGNAKRHSAFSVTSSENASSRSSSLTEVRSDKAESKNTSSKNTTSSEKSQEESDNNSSATSTRNESSSAQSSSRSAASSQGNTSSRQASSKNSSSGNSSSEKQASAQERSSYTAVELADKTIPELIELMGGKFEIGANRDYQKLNGKTEFSCFYMYNYDVFPGMDFYINGVDSELVSYQQECTDNNYKVSDSLTKKVKNYISENRAILTFIFLTGDGALNPTDSTRQLAVKQVTANMTYNQIADACGFDFAVENNDDTAAFDYYGISFIFSSDDINGKTTNFYTDYSTMQKRNPPLYGITIESNPSNEIYSWSLWSVYLWYADYKYGVFNSKRLNELPNGENYLWYLPTGTGIDDMTVFRNFQGDYTESDGYSNVAQYAYTLDRMNMFECIPFKSGNSWGAIGYDGKAVIRPIYDEIKATGSQKMVGVKLEKTSENSNNYYKPPESTYEYSYGIADKFGYGFELGTAGRPPRSYYWSDSENALYIQTYASSINTTKSGVKEDRTVAAQLGNFKSPFVIEPVSGKVVSEDDPDIVLVTNKKRVNNELYTDGGNFADGVIPMKKDGKWGYLDANGNTVIPFEYDATTKADYSLIVGYERELPYDASNGYISLCRNGQYSLVDTSGNVVIPEGEFDKILPVYLKNGRKLSWVKYDNNWGIIEIK